MRILTHEAGAVVIDYQEKLIPAISNRESLIQKSRTLLSGLSALGVPMVVSEQYKKGLGPTAPVIDELAANAPHIEKLSFSCCDTPELMDAISKMEKRFIIICGIEAHVCVLQTVIDLIEKDYRPVLVTDCVGSRFEADKEAAVSRAMQEGAIITTCEALLFELTRQAGTDVFKTISKLVK